MYLDITDENREEATKTLKIEEEFPYLVIYTNGQITDTYSIQENGYSTTKTIKYLNRIGVDELD